MATLRALIDSTKTDKDTVHSYLTMYEALLAGYRHTAERVMEIGVRDGGSILLWQRYFTRAEIHGWDIEPMPDCVRGLDRVVLHENTDAYDPVSIIPVGGFFDVIIDDGPHTLESMLKFQALYLPRLAPGGIAIIEDIQHPTWIAALMAALPSDEWRRSTMVIDLRLIKGRYDDLVLVIKRP